MDLLDIPRLLDFSTLLIPGSLTRSYAEKSQTQLQFFLRLHSVNLFMSRSNFGVAIGIPTQIPTVFQYQKYESLSSSDLSCCRFKNDTRSSHNLAL